jgi:hypothetical protein
MVLSALAVWLRGRKPARSITAATLRRSSGMSAASRCRRRREQAEEAALADDRPSGRSA